MIARHALIVFVVAVALATLGWVSIALINTGHPWLGFFLMLLGSSFSLSMGSKE